MSSVEPQCGQSDRAQSNERGGGNSIPEFPKAVNSDLAFVRQKFSTYCNALNFTRPTHISPICFLSACRTKRFCRIV
jgi:hypothetical protein